MTDTDSARPEFREWVDRQSDPQWGLMPLTHVAKGLLAQDIVRAGRVEPGDCDVFNRSLAYFFYGRPAYRVSGDGAIKTPAACPFCFIFDPRIIDRAHSVHAFDTGAFARRMYSHVFMDEMQVGDFSLGRESSRLNKLISGTFGARELYFDGTTSKIPEGDLLAPQGEFLARAYIDLLRSAGRNEPDDRLCTIEVTFGDPVPLSGDLLAVVVPDILWNGEDKTRWLAELSTQGVHILPFRFLFGREAEHHHAMIEVEIRQFYKDNGYI